MPMFLQRLLAAIDRIVHEFFQMSRSENPFGEGTYKTYYWGMWGRRCAIVDRNGEVTYLGYSWMVHHHYNKDGKLVRRCAMPKLAEAEDTVLYGKRLISLGRKASAPVSHPLAGSRI